MAIYMYVRNGENDVNRLRKLWILRLNNILDEDLCKNIFIPIFSLFFWFYPYRTFKHSKWWRHKLGHTYNT